MNRGDEEKFIQIMVQMEPLVAQANELMREHKNMLQSQRFAMEANSQIIVRQQKEISDNKAVLEDAKGKAQSIISMAEERAKEMEKSLVTRVAEINHQERETKRKALEMEKMLWESKPGRKRTSEAA